MPERPTNSYLGGVDLGDRVILASATDRGRDVLGTVVGRDPYPERDVMVQVLHDDGVVRCRRRDSLRALGHRMHADDLAADLRFLGLAAVDVIANDGDGHRCDAG